MTSYVLGFDEVDGTHVARVGGKGAHLAELARIAGTRTPPGFCVTTDAYRKVLSEAPGIDDQLDRLGSLDPHDREAISGFSAEIRRTIEGLVIPDDLAAAITRGVERLGGGAAYAVRSSATAEDSPTASFAGQHATFLNVLGAEAVLQHVRRCWASLFTERAVSYRLHNGFDHRKVQMAVVVQRMVVPEVSGTLFTAHPVTGNRRVASVEASFGLGEALVSGLVTPDVYEVREGEVIARSIGTKRLALRPSTDGGIEEASVDVEHREQASLTDEQVIELVAIGRRIEAHFGAPQDIEWCLAGEDFRFVQSRPITTLFPVPAVGDGENHVYLSVGHQQMMTDPIKPLGISVWQLTAGRPMFEAGGRLFVDVTQALASPVARAGLLENAGRSDPLMRDALETILERGFIPTVPDAKPGAPPATAPPAPIETDPAIVVELITRTESSIAELKREIRKRTGSALLDFILEDLQELKRILFDPRSHQVVMAGMEATWWLNDQLQEWLGEKSAADTLTQSVPNNVTSEMGLALLDVADAIRPYPEVVDFLSAVDGDHFLEELPRLPGGREARDAIRRWLDRYGMRCVGEIDITRPRWSERPSALVPLILANVRNFAPGAAARLFEQGRREAEEKEREILERLRRLPDGERKAAQAKRMIDRVRTFIGYREYPKYGMINRYFVYRQALLEEAERLVRSGVIEAAEDIFHLTFEELREVVRTGRLDRELIDRRKEEFRSYHALTPPRVLTSEGEAVAGSYRRDELPAGALVGLPVSAGTVEGRARVILDMTQADLEPGDILVTAFTDPSWTPLFLGIRGLVTEVGGLMTHGAVIAREYGLPAVVGVENATRLIRDGQRIRVHGTDGFVEVVG